MSNATDTTPTAGILPFEGVTYRPDREPTIMEVADAAKYDDYSTAIGWLKDVDVSFSKHWSGDRDLLHRWTGHVRIYPDRHQFKINLRQGATRADLDSHQRVIDEVKRGMKGQMPWTERRTAMGELYFALSFARSVHADLPTGEIDADILTPCTEPACIESVHEIDPEDVFYKHTAERIVGNSWAVEVERWADDVEPDRMGAGWTVYVETDECFIDGAAAASFASDLQRAAVMCGKLNDARDVPVTG